MANNPLRDFQKRRRVRGNDIGYYAPAIPSDLGATILMDDEGFGPIHRTKITLDGFVIGNSADNASLGLGAKILTFPAGDILVRASAIQVGLTLDDAVQTDTPEIGLGTVIASGVVAVLGGTATFENIFEGTAVAAVDGTVFKGRKVATASPFALLIAESGGLAHDVFLNVADGWADLTAAAEITADGFITIVWEQLTP